MSEKALPGHARSRTRIGSSSVTHTAADSRDVFRAVIKPRRPRPGNPRRRSRGVTHAFSDAATTVCPRQNDACAREVASARAALLPRASWTTSGSPTRPEPLHPVHRHDVRAIGGSSRGVAVAMRQTRERAGGSYGRVRQDSLGLQDRARDRYSVRQTGPRNSGASTHVGAGCAMLRWTARRAVQSRPRETDFKRRRRPRPGSSGFGPRTPRCACAFVPLSGPGNHRCVSPSRVRAVPDCRVGGALLPACQPRRPPFLSEP